MDYIVGFIDMHKEDAPSESELIKSCLNGLEKVSFVLGLFHYFTLFFNDMKANNEAGLNTIDVDIKTFCYAEGLQKHFEAAKKIIFLFKWIK